MAEGRSGSQGFGLLDNLEWTTWIASGFVWSHDARLDRARRAAWRILFERPACGIGRRRIGYDGSERGNNFIGKRFLGHCRRHSFHFHDDARCHNRRIYFTRLAFDLGEGNMSGTAGNQEASAFIGCILKGLMSQARIPKAFWFASAIR